MGPVRHRHLIRLLSLVVALNMVVGLAVLWTRSGDADGSATAARISADATQGGSILAGGRFTKRRGSQDRPARPAPTAPAAVPGAPAPADQTTTTSPTPGSSTSTAPAPQPSTSTGPAPADPTTTTRPAPTTTTGAPVPTLGPEAAAAGQKGRPGTLTDPAGDTFVDGSMGPINESRADIVRVGSAYAADAITFVLQVERPSDPRGDERWASDSTYAAWEVDTNGDGTPDYEVQYFLLDEDNFGGSVTRPGDEGEAVCDVTVATYSADGYKISIAPACLGTPASFSYRASIFYDTNPADENADVASDITPNGGMSFPVNRPS